MSQHEYYHDPKTEAAKSTWALMNFIVTLWSPTLCYEQYCTFRALKSQGEFKHA